MFKYTDPGIEARINKNPNTLLNPVCSNFESQI